MKSQFETYPTRLVKWDIKGRYAVYYNIEQITLPASDFEAEKTVYQCDQVIAESNSRADIINAIIRSKYSESDEFAIQRKAIAQEPGAQTEFEEYNTFVNAAKAIADEVIEGDGK